MYGLVNKPYVDDAIYIYTTYLFFDLRVFVTMN